MCVCMCICVCYLNPYIIMNSRISLKQTWIHSAFLGFIRFGIVLVDITFYLAGGIASLLFIGQETWTHHTCSRPRRLFGWMFQEMADLVDFLWEYRTSAEFLQQGHSDVPSCRCWLWWCELSWHSILFDRHILLNTAFLWHLFQGFCFVSHVKLIICHWMTSVNHTTSKSVGYLNNMHLFDIQMSARWN